MRSKGILLTVISALIYGFTPVLCSLTYSYGNNPITLTLFRSFLILPVLVVLMMKEHVDLHITLNEYIKITIVALFGSVLTTVMLYSSYQYIGVGTATTLHFMYPLFVTLICRYVYRDKLSKKQIVALLISITGILMFIDFKDLSGMKGIVLALISGITFSIYLVGIEKFKLSTMNNYKLSFYLALNVSICLIIYGGFKGEINLNQPFISYAIMLMVAILAQLIGVICLKSGIAILGSSLASLFSMFEPVSSVLFGIVLLNESINLFKIFGSLLILFGVSLLIKK